jgi:hypothetical protein
MRNRKARARVAAQDNSLAILAAFAALAVLGAAVFSLAG